MAYASVQDVQDRFNSRMDADALNRCAVLLEDASVIIDCYNSEASESAKKLVSCNMVIRALGYSDESVPIGATQGTMSALGYSQTWTLSSGSTGELYISKMEKKLLGTSKIGSHSPLEDI